MGTAPYIAAQTSFVTGAKSITVGSLYANMGDVFILVVETANQVPVTPSGWTLVGSYGFGPAGDSEAALLSVYLKADNSYAYGTIADTGDHQSGVIFAVRGVDPTNLTVSISAIGSQETSASSWSMPDVTTISGNNLIVHAIALDDDNDSTAATSNPTNSNLTGWSTICNSTENTGDGGGLAIISATAVSAGAIGQTTVTPTNPGLGVFMTMVFAPQTVFSGSVTQSLALSHTQSEHTPATYNDGVTVDTIATDNVSDRPSIEPKTPSVSFDTDLYSGTQLINVPAGANFAAVFIGYHDVSASSDYIFRDYFQGFRMTIGDFQGKYHTTATRSSYSTNCLAVWYFVNMPTGEQTFKWWFTPEAQSGKVVSDGIRFGIMFYSNVDPLLPIIQTLQQRSTSTYYTMYVTGFTLTELGGYLVGALSSPNSRHVAAYNQTERVYLDTTPPISSDTKYTRLACCDVPPALAYNTGIYMEGTTNYSNFLAMYLRPQWVGLNPYFSLLEETTSLGSTEGVYDNNYEDHTERATLYDTVDPGITPEIISIATYGVENDFPWAEDNTFNIDIPAGTTLVLAFVSYYDPLIPHTLSYTAEVGGVVMDNATWISRETSSGLVVVCVGLKSPTIGVNSFRWYISNGHLKSVQFVYLKNTDPISPYGIPVTEGYSAWGNSLGDNDIVIDREVTDYPASITLGYAALDDFMMQGGWSSDWDWQKDNQELISDILLPSSGYYYYIILKRSMRSNFKVTFHNNYTSAVSIMWMGAVNIKGITGQPTLSLEASLTEYTSIVDSWGWWGIYAGVTEVNVLAISVSAEVLIFDPFMYQDHEVYYRTMANIVTFGFGYSIGLNIITDVFLRHDVGEPVFHDVELINSILVSADFQVSYSILSLLFSDCRMLYSVNNWAEQDYLIEYSMAGFDYTQRDIRLGYDLSNEISVYSNYKYLDD